MSHGVLAPQRSTFASRKTVNGSRGSTTPWVRPADWLALTTPSTSDQRMVGLAAVFQSNSNFVTVRASSAFKVDWGDGAGWNLYAANTTAEKNLQWADYDAGTLCSRGYRQAIVTVEPQSGNLTGLELRYRHSNAAASSNTSSVWLDLRVACTGSPTISGPSPQWLPRMLESVTVASNTASASYLFYGCTWLQSVSVATTGCVSFTNMFRGCSALRDVPQFDTSSGTDFSSMFNGCTTLQRPPTCDTSSGSNFNGMFANCLALQVVPALNVSAGTDFGSMFNGCSALQWSDVYGGTRGISYATANLSAAALNNIYTKLGTAAGAQTITVTSNWGTAGDDPTIATAKGWTVAGS